MSTSSATGNIILAASETLGGCLRLRNLDQSKGPFTFISHFYIV